MEELNFFDAIKEILHFSRLNIFHSFSCDGLAEEAASDCHDSVSLWPQSLIRPYDSTECCWQIETKGT